MNTYHFVLYNSAFLHSWFRISDSAFRSLMPHFRCRIPTHLSIETVTMKTLAKGSEYIPFCALQFCIPTFLVPHFGLGISESDAAFPMLHFHVPINRNCNNEDIGRRKCHGIHTICVLQVCIPAFLVPHFWQWIPHQDLMPAGGMIIYVETLHL